MVEAVVDYEAVTAAATVNVYTDLDGAWVTATAISCPASTTPATVRATMANKPATGFKVDFVCPNTSNAVFKPRNMNIKVRKIGLYLTQNQTWSTGEIPINI
jgi:hypothetical protein